MPTKKSTVKKETKAVVHSIKNIKEALFLFQREQITLPKRGKGTSSKGTSYMYVMFDDMVNIVRPTLDKYGMGFTQLVQNDTLETVLFHHASDTEITSSINLGSPNNMQDYGGRITYTKRYALGAMLGISSEEDVDATPVGQDIKIEHTPSVAMPKEAPTVSLAPVSDSYKKALMAIDTAVSGEALEVIKTQIDRSARLSEVEKKSLQEILLAKETEVEGTIR